MTQQLPFRPSMPPPFVGPPPRPPQRPEPFRRNDLLHLLLTLFTAGLWIPVWILIGMNANSMARKDEQRYREQVVQYRIAYDAWQYRYHQVYGVPPPPPY